MAAPVVVGIALKKEKRRGPAKQSPWAVAGLGAAVCHTDRIVQLPHGFASPLQARGVPVNCAAAAACWLCCRWLLAALLAAPASSTPASLSPTLPPAARKKHISDKLVAAAAEAGIRLRFIDKEQPLEAQGPFAAILQKVRKPGEPAGAAGGCADRKGSACVSLLLR